MVFITVAAAIEQDVFLEESRQGPIKRRPVDIELWAAAEAHYVLCFKNLVISSLKVRINPLTPQRNKALRDAAILLLKAPDIVADDASCTVEIMFEATNKNLRRCAENCRTLLEAAWYSDGISAVHEPLLAHEEMVIGAVAVAP